MGDRKRDRLTWIILGVLGLSFLGIAALVVDNLPLTAPQSAKSPSTFSTSVDQPEPAAAPARVAEKREPTVRIEHLVSEPKPEYVPKPLPEGYKEQGKEASESDYDSVASWLRAIVEDDGDWLDCDFTPLKPLILDALDEDPPFLTEKEWAHLYNEKTLLQINCHKRDVVDKRKALKAQIQELKK